jgi:hypothetical protein
MELRGTLAASSTGCAADEPNRADKALAGLFVALVAALCALGAVFLFRYRSASPAIGPYSWRYALGVLAHYLALCGLTAGLVTLPARLWDAPSRWFGRVPAWVRPVLVLVPVALGERWAFLVNDEYASVLLMVIVAATAAAFWVRLRGRTELALALAPVVLLALVLFAIELPSFLSSPPLAVWGDGSTFGTLFPSRPPFIGPGGRLRANLNTRMRAPEYPRCAH